VLDARELRARVTRRGLPRRLRHFQRVPKIEFSDRDGATQLALVCSDRPGLLAEVAQVLHEARVRVHDARIATFGERVEDFFVLTTDESGSVLDESARDALRTALQDRLGAAAPPNQRVNA
jgi:[protein-PII] uridylyltransferase